MHEVSVCDNLLDIVEDTAKQHNARGVKAVRISVGEISGVVPELLEHAFDVLAPEREMTRQARLLIDRISPRALCEKCGAEFSPQDYVFLCPSCGSGRTRLLAGDELRIEKLELEV